jgi:FkbM family methyltransferase
MGRSPVLAQALHRMREGIRTVYLMRSAGATIASITLFPLRRRLPRGRARLDFRNSLCVVAPAEDRLASLLDEIWLQECYDRGAEAHAGDTIIDVGAHVGIFTIRAAQKWPQARVVAVEPSTRLFAFLCENISRNRLANVTPFQAACAGKSGRSTLYLRSGHEHANTLYRPSDEWQPQADTEVLSLDDLFARCDIQSCSLLKLDCEGAEYDTLFQAGAKTLARVRRIAMEYHTGPRGEGPEHLAAFLADRGFKIDPLEPMEKGRGYLRARRP